jgi:signal peptidase I
MLFLKWFTSRSVRHAWQAARHVEKILHHQRDLLTPEAVALVQADVDGLSKLCREGDKKAITDSLARLEKTANKWLKPYPNSALRENIEVALVAIAVAMAIRTFVLQPFKIPTGSMQPTLYGVTPSENDLPGTQEDLRGQPDPGFVASFFDYWFSGVQHFHIVARASGPVTWDEPTKAVLFNIKQTYSINGVRQPPIWFPPDALFRRAGVFPGSQVNAGDDIVKLRVISGDHLFVDRVSFNFRRPRRGDIVVFETHGITRLDRSQQDTYYIKRLCGLGGETLELKPRYEIINPPQMDRAVSGTLVVDGRELTANTPHFEHLYAFADAPNGRTKTLTFRDNHYFGHGLLRDLGEGKKVHVPPNHYFVMGDNTYNSSDSRYWGDFDQTKVIGKSCFVYWPIGGTIYKGEKRSSRFGWAHW